MDNSADRWKTPNASWLNMERAGEGEVLITKLKAGEERLLKCLTDEEEF